MDEAGVAGPGMAAGAARSAGSGSAGRGSARARLLEAAAREFYARGIGATGIDTITAEAGIAKQSLYNNFASKSELVLAYVRARDEEWFALYDARAAGARDARDRVLAVFDAYIDHAEAAYEHRFRGCGLLNAAAELTADDPARAVVRDHKERVERLLAGHLAELAGADEAGADSVGISPGATAPAGAERAARLAEHLCFLLEGAMARAGLEGAPDRLLHARALAAALLDALPAATPNATSAPASPHASPDAA